MVGWKRTSAAVMLFGTASTTWVWVTKYRYPCLGEMLGSGAENYCVRRQRRMRWLMHAGSVNRDHVRMLVSIPPSLSVSRAVQHLKGRSSHKLLSEFGILRKRYWGQHLWARGYWVASSGNVTDEVWADPARTGRRRVRRRRTDPALSRNLKPPPFRRWSIHTLCPSSAS